MLRCFHHEVPRVGPFCGQSQDSDRSDQGYATEDIVIVERYVSSDHAHRLFGASWQVPLRRIMQAIKGTSGHHPARKLRVLLKEYRDSSEAEEGLAGYFRIHNLEQLHQSLEHRKPATIYHR